ncbi:MAG: tetratricopeptide repeat protein [Candidatus Aminicenantes bacterium]|nr:tetratricopeptide repeat protein [Candidatus Aminicenantes bacterium]
MRKKAIYLIFFLFSSSFLISSSQTHPDEILFQSAKVLIFDEKWEEAQEKLEELIENYPDSQFYSQAHFYRAKCLSEQKGREAAALKAYKSFLKQKDKNKSLIEESEISIMQLAYGLYERGRKSYLLEIEERIDSPSKVIRYFAAIKLSFVNNKRIASKGIPVLKQIIRKEKDAELKDRAKIALLRIDPDALKDLEDEDYEERMLILKLRVYSKGEKEPEFSLNIPWALADLALLALSEEDKENLIEEGYDLDEIIDRLLKERGEIIRVVTKTKIFKIWID